MDRLMLAFAALVRSLVNGGLRGEVLAHRSQNRVAAIRRFDSGSLMDAKPEQVRGVRLHGQDTPFLFVPIGCR
jgi:hypothetical protein